MKATLAKKESSSPTERGQQCLGYKGVQLTVLLKSFVKKSYKSSLHSFFLIFKC